MAKIGFHFGTANSAASYRLPDGTIHVCQSRHGPFAGAMTTPSFVRFNADGSVAKYGAAAYNELVHAPEYVVWGVTRLLGKGYQQARQNGALQRFAYPIEESADGSIDIRIGVTRYKPLDVVRILLQCIKKDCEAPFNPIGAAVDEAVITRPAYFEPEAVTELKRAALDPPPGSPNGTPGRFRSVELLTEPEAAGNAYSPVLWSAHDRQREKWVMTIVWSADTLDVVISRMCRDDTGVARVTSVFPPYGIVVRGLRHGRRPGPGSSCHPRAPEAGSAGGGRPAARGRNGQDHAIDQTNRGSLDCGRRPVASPEHGAGRGIDPRQ